MPAVCNIVFTQLLLFQRRMATLGSKLRSWRTNLPVFPVWDKPPIESVEAATSSWILGVSYPIFLAFCNRPNCPEYNLSTMIRISARQMLNSSPVRIFFHIASCSKHAWEKKLPRSKSTKNFSQQFRQKSTIKPWSRCVTWGCASGQARFSDPQPLQTAPSLTEVTECFTWSAFVFSLTYFAFQVSRYRKLARPVADHGSTMVSDGNGSAMVPAMSLLYHSIPQQRRHPGWSTSHPLALAPS